MWKEIKSSFFVYKIFLHINYSQKLKLVMYDKKPNKCLNLSITDFRRVSGKYIIGEKNGFVKEYNCYIDEFLFEGEYLKGKKKEKGKNLLKIVK